jgi:hypothetical protein
MATISAGPAVSSFDHFAHERRLHQCLRALQTCGWEQRLQPLATHMIEKRLVRARGEACAPLRHLDLEVLRAALSRLLSLDGGGYLIYHLVVEGADPGLVAAERGVSRAVLVEQLRDAVDELAMEYEDTANAHLDGSPAEQVWATLARKRG